MKIRNNNPIQNNVTKEQSLNKLQPINTKQEPMSDSFLSKTRNLAMRNYLIAALTLAATSGLTSSCAGSDFDSVPPDPYEHYIFAKEMYIEGIQELDAYSDYFSYIFFGNDKRDTQYHENIRKIIDEDKAIIDSLSNKNKDFSCLTNDDLKEIFGENVSNTMYNDVDKKQYLIRMNEILKAKSTILDKISGLFQLRLDYSSKAVFENIESNLNDIKDNMPPSFVEYFEKIKNDSDSSYLQKIKDLYKAWVSCHMLI